MFRVQFQPEHRKLVLGIAGGSLIKQEGNIITVEGGDDMKKRFQDTDLCGRGIAILGLKGFDADETTLTINFPSVRHAKVFKEWLCGSGEQDFWQWCEAQEEPLSYFDYHDPGGSVIPARGD